MVGARFIFVPGDSCVSQFFARTDMLAKIPLARFGTTADMGAVASFLLSDVSAYITGETVVASGGVRSRL